MMFWSIRLLPFASFCLFKDPLRLSRLAVTRPRDTCTSISLATETNYGSEESSRSTTLLETAKKFDGSLARDNSLGEYSESMWSNRCVCNFDLDLSSFQRKTLLFFLIVVSPLKFSEYFDIKQSRNCINPGCRWSFHRRPTILLEQD